MSNYSNIAVQTTLDGAIVLGDLTLTVADATGYPAVPFRIVLDPGVVTDEEVCQVTAKTGPLFTVTRGYDGTTAKSHANGATVIHAVVAADLTDLQAADTALSSAIGSEASTRSSADTALSGSISTEATARANADTALQTNITNEASARAAADALLQPLDSDLTAIAALATTSFGRALLTLVDAAAGRSNYGLGTAAVADTGTGAANVPTITQADARYQPLDSDLTAIAALSTTSYGRSLLTLADAAAGRTSFGLGSLAVLSTITASLISDASANGQSLITAANYAAMRTLIGLVIGTNVQAWDADLDAIAALTATTDNFIVSVASAWASRTPAQVRTTLALGALALKATIATADIDNDAVTYAKMQNVSATSRILGRATAGAGDVEELTGAQALAITGAGQAPTVNVFTSTTLAWPIPAGVTQFYMEVIGGGGGGGAGRRGAAGSARGGAGGGGSGGRSWGYIRKSDLGSATTLDITIGAGGAGGAAQTANDTNGSTGSAGGSTSIAITSGATLMQATAGAANNAGTTTAGGAGGSIGGSQDIGNQGGTGGLGAGAGNGNQNTTTYAGGVPGGGGGGGGISTGNAIDNGGTGGIVRSTILTGAAGGASPGGAGVNGTASPVVVGPGGGGSGGASSITGVAGSGGVGGNYGAGGGGGGASLNGNNSGAGGNGAQGVAVIICW